MASALRYFTSIPTFPLKGEGVRAAFSLLTDSTQLAEKHDHDNVHYICDAF